MYAMKQKSFVPTKTLLNEDMYTANRQKLKTVENLFDQALALIDKDNWRRSDRAGIQKLFDKISVIINKKFNVEMRLMLDVKAAKTSSVAYTVYTEDVADIIKSQVEEIVIDEKYGYHFIEAKKIDVSFELVALSGFLNLGEITNKNGYSYKFEGRHMVSVLLHEIGHNVFIPFYFDQDNDKNYRVKIGKQKPIIIYKDFLKYKELSAGMRFLAATLSLISVAALGVASAGVLPATFFASLGISAASAILSHAIAKSDKTFAKDYMRNERNANTLPFQYGYVKEILEETVMIQKLIVDGEFSGLYKNFQKMDKSFWTNGGYQSIITKDIMGMINTELNNPNTNEKDKALLKKAKETYLREIKLLQAEVAIDTEGIDG